MAFHSMSELKAYLMPKMEETVEIMRKDVSDTIMYYLQQFYEEYYPPVQYVRTYQLLNSLVKTEVKQVGLGYTASVYFDTSLLDYSWKLVATKRNKKGEPIRFEKVHKHDWSHGKDLTVLNIAMVGKRGDNPDIKVFDSYKQPHGGYNIKRHPERLHGNTNTRIWVQTVKFLQKYKSRIIDILRVKGIPCKRMNDTGRIELIKGGSITHYD